MARPAILLHRAVKLFKHLYSSTFLSAYDMEKVYKRLTKLMESTFCEVTTRQYGWDPTFNQDFLQLPGQKLYGCHGRPWARQHKLWLESLSNPERCRRRVDGRSRIMCLWLCLLLVFCQLVFLSTHSVLWMGGINEWCSTLLGFLLQSVLSANTSDQLHVLSISFCLYSIPTTKCSSLNGANRHL